MGIWLETAATDGRLDGTDHGEQQHSLAGTAAT
jgi:hypothetical protein